MTRNRAAPLVAMIVIVAATMLIAVTPAQATATTQTKLQQFNEAPAINQAAIATPADFGLALEVASPPDVAWASSNQVFANYTAASVSTRAAPVNVALVTNSTVDAKKNLVLGAARAAPLAAQNNNLTYSAAGNAANDFKMNLVIENTRVAPATNDMKIAAIGQINDAKKTAASYGAVDGA